MVFGESDFSSIRYCLNSLITEGSVFSFIAESKKQLSLQSGFCDSPKIQVYGKSAKPCMELMVGIRRNLDKWQSLERVIQARRR